MLVKLENKEHNLAAALLNLGSASDLLRRFKKKFRGLNLSVVQVEGVTKRIIITVGRWRWGVGILSHTPGLLNGNSEGKAEKATFLTGAPSGYQRRLHSF